MPFQRRDTGAWVDIATTRKRRDTGAWVNLDLVRRRSGGAWTVIWQSIIINNQSINRTAGAATTAGYRLNTSGIAEKLEGASYTTLETWLGSPGYASSSYEARATLQSGDPLSSGTVGTWQALSSSREWQQQATLPGTTLTSTLLIEIRNATTLAVVDTATITLTSERL
jgi:hypothetical protein